MTDMLRHIEMHVDVDVLKSRAVQTLRHKGEGWTVTVERSASADGIIQDPRTIGRQARENIRQALRILDDHPNLK
jgi:hypothetical protein